MPWRKALLFVGMISVVIWLLGQYPSLMLASGLAAATLIIMLRTTKGLTQEWILTGAIIGYLSAYHFYLQPVRPDVLPGLDGPLLWYFGVYIALRLTLFIALVLKIPVLADLSRHAGAN